MKVVFKSAFFDKLLNLKGKMFSCKHFSRTVLVWKGLLPFHKAVCSPTEREFYQKVVRVTFCNHICVQLSVCVQTVSQNFDKKLQSADNLNPYFGRTCTNSQREMQDRDLFGTIIEFPKHYHNEVTANYYIHAKGKAIFPRCKFYIKHICLYRVF